MFKRILSLLLCFAFVCSLVPFTQAQESGAEGGESVAIAQPQQQLGVWLLATTVYERGAGSAEALMQQYAELGITDVYLQVKGISGKLAWSSSVSGSAPLYADRDILAEVCAAAAPYGIRIHAWMMAARDDSYAASNGGALYYHFRYGYGTQINRYVSLRDEGYIAYMSALVQELTQKYGVAGIHLDNARYGSMLYDWGRDARDTLLTKYGITIAQYNAATLALCAHEKIPCGTSTASTAGYNGGASYSFYAYRENGTIPTVDPIWKLIEGSDTTSDAAIGAKAFYALRTDTVTQFIEAMDAAAGENVTVSSTLMPDSMTSAYYAALYGQEAAKLADAADYVALYSFTKEFASDAAWLTKVVEKCVSAGCKTLVGVQTNDTAYGESVYADTVAAYQAIAANDKLLGLCLSRGDTALLAGADFFPEKGELRVKVSNQSAQNVSKLVIGLQNGMKVTAVGESANWRDTYTVSVSADGTSVTLSANSADILNVGEMGYLNLTVSGTLTETAPVALVQAYSGAEFTEIPAFSGAVLHTYTTESTTPPTCATMGSVNYACSHCGNMLSEPIETLPHSYTYTDNRDATHSGACVACGESILAAHEYKNGVCVCGAKQADNNMLYFSFDQSEADALRYQSAIYGYTDFNDTYNWCLSRMSNTGLADGVVSGTIDKDGAYLRTSIGGTTNFGDCPLQYVPGENDVFQVCFKLENTTATNAGVKLYYYETGAENWETDLAGTGKPVVMGEYMVATIPLANTIYADVTQIAGIQVAFYNVPDGEISVDYIYIGPESNLPTAHDFEVVVTPSTCTEQGYTTYTCKNCGLSYKTEYVPAAHTVVADAAVEANCTEAGLTEGSHCSVCGEVLVAQETVPAKGHTKVIDAAVAATCTKTGLTEGSHCSACGEVFAEQEELPALGHALTEADENGSYSCTRCDLVGKPIVNIANGSILLTEENGVKYYTVGDVRREYSGTFTITGTTESNNVTVQSGTHDVVLSDTAISSNAAAFSVVAQAAVNLTLAGSNSLHGGLRCAGLQVPEGAAVSIDGEGSLSAGGGIWAAGIGGGEGSSCGNITINSGSVTATSDTWGAGIGGGYNGAGGNITVNGGSVTATSGIWGAGIGGGYNGAAGNITINGGSVTATSGTWGAGIGAGGESDAGGTITINGGSTQVNNAPGELGIGGASCEIFISGGNVMLGHLQITAEEATIWGGNICTSEIHAKNVFTGLYEGFVETELYLEGVEDGTPIDRIIGAEDYGLKDVKTYGSYLDLYLFRGTAQYVLVEGVLYENDGTGYCTVHSHDGNCSDNLNDSTHTCECGYTGPHTVKDGICTGCGARYVAQVGTMFYTRLEKALRAVPNNGELTTVTLFCDTNINDNDWETVGADCHILLKGENTEVYIDYIEDENDGGKASDVEILGTLIVEGVLIYCGPHDNRFINNGILELRDGAGTPEIVNNGTLRLSGAPYISSVSGGTLEIVGDLTGNPITIYMDAPGVFGKLVDVSAENVQKLASGEEGYYVKLNEDNTLELAAHQHEWTLQAKNGCVEYFCTNTDGFCTQPETSVLTLNAPETDIYDGIEKAFTYTNGIADAQIGEITYNGSTQAPVDAGSYTVSMSVSMGELSCTLETVFVLQRKTLMISNVYLAQKIYDGTTAVEPEDIALVGLVGADDVRADFSNVAAHVNSADAGSYTEVALSGIVLKGMHAENYCLNDGTAPTQLTILPRPITVTADDQSIMKGEQPDQSKYSCEGLLEGHAISSLVLTPNTTLPTQSGTVTPSDAVIVQGETDVTANYDIRYVDGKLEIVCAEHIYDIYTDNKDGTHTVSCICGKVSVTETHSYSDYADHSGGFCTVCDAYEPAVWNAEDECYEISNAGQLYWFAELVNTVDGTFTYEEYEYPNYVNASANAVLTNDIVINRTVLDEDGKLTANTDALRTWTPIGYAAITEENGKDLLAVGYTGSFDGKDYSISGLYLNDTSAKYVGLFGILGSYFDAIEGGRASLKNLTITDSYICAYEYIGAFAGMVIAGDISNCHHSGTVAAPSTEGGHTGGLVGYSIILDNKISGCTNSGTVIATGYYVGGLIGYMDVTTVSDCSNSGTLVFKSSHYAGGIVGGNGGGTIQNCYSSADIVGGSVLGGIAGGNSADGVIENCYNLGALEGYSEIGGIVGYNTGNITNCYNNGAISGINTLGGIVGDANTFGGMGIINNCYNSAKVIAKEGERAFFVGGIAGRLFNATIENCYYPTGCAVDGGGTVQNGVGCGAVGETKEDAENSTIAVSMQQFASGEVAYLLGEAFGQELGKDAYPILGEPKVYLIQNCLNADVYSNTDADLGHQFDENKVCTVCGASIVAMIGETEFTDLHAAIAEAKSGETVTLIADIVLTEKLMIEADDNIILDLNGHKLTTFAVNSNYDVVIKGDLTICDSAENGEMIISGIYGIGVSTTAGASLTVNGGTFTHESGDYMIGSWGTVTITDGIFNASYCAVNCFAGTGSISGGSFSASADDSEVILGNTTLTGGNYDRDVSDYCAVGYVARQNTNGSYDVAACTHENCEYTYENIDASWHSVICSCGVKLSDSGHSYEDGACTLCGRGLIENGNIVLTEADGVKYYTVGDSEPAPYEGSFCLSGTTTEYNLTVESGTHEIILRDVSIDVSALENADAITITNDSNVTLVLHGENTLKGSSNSDSGAGVEVDGNAAVHICGEGKLTAIGGYGAAGIGAGGGHFDKTGEINISSGTIVAVGGENGCGIGASDGAEACVINITGGNITAIGGNGAAGIGGCGNIGVGAGGQCGQITISGGVITAIGGAEAAGIGSGRYYDGYTSEAANDFIRITGGDITAIGGGCGAGIGSGSQSKALKIYIEGGNITATGGSAELVYETDEESGEEKLTAFYAAGAGIGSGAGAYSAQIFISGGTITAVGGNGIAQTVTEGDVTGQITFGAGAGIGSGAAGHACDVVITGGNIKATAGEMDGEAESRFQAQAIGHGGDFVIYVSEENKQEMIAERSGTVTDGNGNEVYLNTITIDGVTEQTEVTKLGGVEGYGLNDVKTLDTNVLYLWLPESSVPTAVEIGESKYVGTMTDKAGTFTLYIPPIYDGDLKFSHSLTLENDISINFIGQGSALNAYDTFYLECTVPVYNGNEKVGTKIVEIQPVFNGTNYEFTLTGVTAKMMNDEIEAIFRLTKDGQEYYSKTDVYSVAEYAYGKLDSTKAADTAELKAICANLLRYGSMAQTQFGYRTDALVDAAMTEAHKAYLTDLSTVEMKDYRKQLSDHDAPTVPWKSTTLELGNKVIMCLIANLANYTGDPSELTMRLTFTDNNGTVITEERLLELYNPDAKTYAVSYDGLRATEMRTIVSAAIYHGETRVSKTVEYSIESYGARSSDTAMQTLCLAMLAYGDSANAFFSK